MLYSGTRTLLDGTTQVGLMTGFHLFAGTPLGDSKPAHVDSFLILVKTKMEKPNLCQDERSIS